MNKAKESWEWEGRKITEQKSWDFEIEPEEMEDVAATPALANVNVKLCYRCEVVLSTRGEFYVVWKERHQKVPSWEKFFGRTKEGRSARRIAQYTRLTTKHPPESYADEITARTAYEIIARFWLPREFHLDAGLRPAESAKRETGDSRLADLLRSLVPVAESPDVRRSTVETIAWLQTRKLRARKRGGFALSSRKL